MNNKTQSEYLSQLKGDWSNNHLDKVAPKLAYEWIKTGKLKQDTLLKWLLWLRNT